jgi:hypothetical protein
VRWKAIGLLGGAGTQGGGAGAPLPGPFRLLFVSRVFSYLLDYRKVVRSPFVYVNLTCGSSLVLFS